MKMRDVEHAAGLFTNGLATSFYAVRLSGFLAFRLSGFLAFRLSGFPAFSYFLSRIQPPKRLLQLLNSPDLHAEGSIDQATAKESGA